jgi:hypothetical protein
VWLPTDSEETVVAPRPLARVMVARAVAPSRRVTVPDGVPAAGATAVTLTWSGMAWPKEAGVRLEVTVTSTVAWSTWCEPDAEVLAAKLASPEYRTVKAWLPEAS